MCETAAGYSLYTVDIVLVSMRFVCYLIFLQAVWHSACVHGRCVISEDRMACI